MDWRLRLRRLVAEIPDDEMPALVGELARAQLEAELRARLGANGASLKTYTATEAAKELGRDVTWVRRHAKALGAVRADGGVLLFPEANLRRFLEGR